MNLIQASVANPVKVAVGVLLVTLFGLLALLAMPTQLTPEVQIPTITVDTRWRGASPMEIEREIVQPLFPLVWEAFLDYRVEAMRLTRLDRDVIRRLVAQSGAGGLPASNEAFLAAQHPSWAGLQRSRERDECLEKMVSLGLVRPAAAADSPA